MGNVKDNMDIKKKSTKDSEERSNLFGRFTRRVKKEDAPKTFAEMILKADECLDKLVIEKEVEFEKEKNDKEYNSQALCHLNSIRFHLDMVIDHAAAYGDLRKK